VAYQMSPLPMPLNGLKGSLLLFETFLAPIPRETLPEFTNIARRAVLLL